MSVHKLLCCACEYTECCVVGVSAQAVVCVSTQTVVLWMWIHRLLCMQIHRLLCCACEYRCVVDVNTQMGVWVLGMRGHRLVCVVDVSTQIM